MPRKVKGVVFDFSGVIVDDYPLKKEVWSKLSEKLRGKPVTDKEMVQKIRGVQTEETIKWLGEGKLTPEEIKKLAKEKDEMVRELYLPSPLFCLNKGLQKVFDDLKTKGIPRTIATSSKLNSLLFSFKRLNLKRWFELKDIVYNDGNHKGKPAPDAYLLAISKIGQLPEECVVFEDAASGIKSAYAAGVHYIVAVGSDERLKILTKLPGVVKGIHNFTEISVEEIWK